MSKIYYGDRASGGSLKHYRTKGSRNGYSKNPNYKVVGQRAKGRWVNGRYVYDQPTNNPMYSKSSSQSRGFLGQYSYGAHQRTSDPVRDRANEKAAATRMKLAAARGSQNNWQQQAARAQAGLQSNMQGPRTTPSGMGNDPRYTQQVQSQSKPGAASRIKQKARVAKASAKGAQNDWQRTANAAASYHEALQRYTQGRSRDVMKMDDANNPYLRPVVRDIDNRYVARNGEQNINGWKKDDSYANAQKRVEDRKKARGSNAMYNDPRYNLNKKSGSKSAKRSKEYEEELAYNSQRNVYPSGSSGASSPRTSGMGNDPRYNIEGSQKIERAKQEAARKAKEKETKGQYFTFDEKTGRTVKTSPGIEEEKKRIEEGKKRHAKVRAKREKAAKRAALINKIKDKISSFFKKKK